MVPMTDQSAESVESGDFLTEYLRANQMFTFGWFDRVDRALGDAIRFAVRDEDVAGATMERASVRFWRLGDLAGAHRVLDEAVSRLGDCPAAEIVEAQRAVLWFFSGRTVRALVVCRGVRRRNRGPVGAMMLSAAIEAMALGLRGEPATMVASLNVRAKDELDELQYGFHTLAVTFSYVINGLVVEPGGAVPGVDPAGRAAMRLSSEGLALMLDGLSLLWAGRPRSAGGPLEEAVAHLRRSDRANLLPAALGALAYCHALIGDTDGASRAVEDAEELCHPVARLVDFYVDRGRAWTDAARGELTAARDRLAASADACTERGQLILAAQAWHDVARLGDATRAAAALSRLAAWARSTPPGEDGLIALLAAHVEALAAGDAAGVAAAAQRALNRGHRLHAAEAAAQAAALYGRRRHRADADRWRELADTLAAGCEGALTPALHPLFDLDLTPREREIVGLAAQGLTNPDIARRLHVSVRTVGNHLQSSYVKLGVHRREELARLHPFGVEP
jgi:DNA-binding NarL/FixJ family response regulator